MTHMKCWALGLLAALGATSTLACAEPGGPRIGVQLWSGKDEIRQDFEGTLTRLAALGIEGVEFAGEFGPYRTDPAGLKAFLARTGLRCIGAHLPFDALHAASFDATTAFFRTAGCRDLVIPMDARGASNAGAEDMARELTALSAKLAPLGLRVGYHNHAQEMAGIDGSTPWDVLARNTPRQVILQQDVGWTSFAGKDPVAYVKKYPGRTVSLHYKAKFLKGTTGKAPIIGQDHTDWVGLTAAVRSVGGTEWMTIEQEEYPNGMGQLQSVAASMHGLQVILAQMAGGRN
jgi:sugar phosphate isomerase/epimerase